MVKQTLVNQSIGYWLIANQSIGYWLIANLVKGDTMDPMKPQVGDVLECSICGMTLECTVDCDCTDDNCAELKCCGRPLVPSKSII